MSSYIKIPLVDPGDVPTPADGRLIFADITNNGNISAKETTGDIYDLTKASNALFNSSANEITEYKVNEFNRTLTPAEILDMKHDKFYAPEDGIELLPAPGAGKCYIISMDGIFVNYVSNGNPGYIAKNYYGEERTIDIYYQYGGASYVEDTNKISSISLMASDESEWLNKWHPELRNTPLISKNARKKEFLGIDRKADNLIYQQQTIGGAGTGFSPAAIENSPIYVGTNGDLEKLKSTTDGTISIRFWYSIIDISDLYTRPAVANPLPAFATGMRLAKGINSFFSPGFDFLDNELCRNGYDYWDNFPVRTPAGNPINGYSTFNDGDTLYRINRDFALKGVNEWTIGNLNGDAFGYQNRVNSAGTSVPLTTYPAFPHANLNYESRIMSMVPIPIGPTLNTLANLPFELDYLEAREAYSQLGPNIYQSNLPYEVTDGAVIFTGFEANAAEEYFYDSTNGRISSLEITNPGTGYVQGEEITFTGGGGTNALAVISNVGPSGEILSVSFKPGTAIPGQYYLGGRDYTSAPTASITTVSGINAVITPTYSAGQWIPDFVRSGIDVAQAAADQRGIRDAANKSINEFCLATGPFLRAAYDIPGFQLEKYKL